MHDTKIIMVVDNDSAMRDNYQKIFTQDKNNPNILDTSEKKTENEIDLHFFSLPSQLVASFTAEEKKGNRIPLCILDLSMPEQNGLETAQLLRAINEDVTIIICSAYSATSAALLKNNIQDNFFLIHKPFSPDEFKLLVHSLLREWQVRQNLIKSEEKYRLLTENNHDIVYMLNAEGLLTFVSPSWTVLLGHPMTEVIGKYFDAFIHPDDLPVCNASFQKVVTEGQRLEGIEYRVLHQDGSWRWHTTSVVPLINTDGTISALYGTARDITKQKQISDSLKISEENFRTFFSSIADLLFVLDEKATIIDVNETVLRRLEYKKEELIGKSVLFVHPENRQVEAGEIVTAMLEGKTDFCPIPIISKNGLEIQVETRVYPGVWNGKKSLFGVVKDVTSIKQSEEKFSQAFQAGSSLMAISTLETGIYRDVNDMFVQMLGYSRNEVIGQSSLKLHIFVNYKQRDLITSSMKDYGFAKNIELQLRTKNGTVIDVLFSASAITIGTERCMLSSVIDITERNVLEKALKDSETLQRTLLTSLPVGVILVDPVTRIIESANEYVVFLFGGSVEHLVGQQCHSLLCPSSRGSCPVCDLRQCVDNADHIMLRIDGTKLPILKTVKLIKVNNQEKLLECFIDISERKQAEKEILNISQRLTLATQAGGVGIWDFDLVNDILVWDDQMYRLYGISADQVKGAYSAWVSGVHPDDKERVDSEIQRAITGEKEFDTEFRIIHPDGTIHFIRALATVERDSEEKAIRMIGTNWDITVQKKIEATVIAQSELQKILMETSSIFINIPLDEMNSAISESLCKIAQFVGADRSYIFDYDFNTKTCTNTFEWCGEGIKPQINKLQKIPLEGIPNWIDNHRKGNSMYIPNVEALEKNNNNRQILEPQGIKSLITVPLMHKNECRGFIGFDSIKKTHEYTENERNLLTVFSQMMISLGLRTQTQDNLRKAVIAAEAASKAKSEFLANMSHEIRTPLNGVIGFTELLQNTQLTEVQYQYVKNANASGRTLLGIINDILDFSKIEAGMMDLELLKTDMIDLLETSVDIIKYAAGKKNLEVLLDIDPCMPRFALVDPVRLKQIFANLMGNAVKFTTKGEIELKVRYENISSNRGRFCFSVRDSGIGITQEQQTKLFKAFTQADSSTTRKFGGTGLGLMISEMIANKMGSKIHIDSFQGRGSTFFFAIVTNVEQGDKTDSSEIQSIKRSLIIDDNENNRLILEHTMSAWGITCMSCDNGLDALKKIETSEPFDVIICDYHMPYIDGLETIKMIREKLHLSPQKLPIILLHSSSDDAELHKKCDELGVRFRLTKPVKADELLCYLCNIHTPGEALITNEETANSNTVKNPISEKSPLILIAEDNVTNMLLVKVIIEKLLPSVRVIEACDGKEALSLFQKEQPDLILMDMQMPEMDGVEATIQIRNLEKKNGGHTPIVALTAGALKEEKEKCLLAGMDDFLTKPIESDKLAHALHTFLAL